MLHFLMMSALRMLTGSKCMATEFGAKYSNVYLNNDQKYDNYGSFMTAIKCFDIEETALYLVLALYIYWKWILNAFMN